MSFTEIGGVEEETYSAPTGPYRAPTILFRDEKQQLHIHAEHVTFIFVEQGEVHSIHFDRKRQQIFYRGHNLANSVITKTMAEALKQFGLRLSVDERTSLHYSDYRDLLQHLLSQKKSRIT